MPPVGGDDPVDGFTDPRESLKRSLELVRLYCST